VTTFSVDLSLLRGVYQALDGVRSQLADTTATTSDYAGALGDAGLEGRLERFFSDWSDYWTKLSTNADHVLTALANAIESYQSAEESIRGAADGGSTAAPDAKATQ